jgi:hypothetical protein
MKSIRMITATLAATALVAAGAPTAMAQSGPAPDTAGQSERPAKKKGKRGPRRLSAAQLAKVATALGTDAAPLKAALDKVKATVDASEARETKAERDALLAGELGVTVEALRAAFASVRGSTDGKCKPRGPAPATDNPSDSSGT